MPLPLSSALIALGVLVLVVWALWFVAADRAVVLRQLWVAAFAEVVALVQLVVLVVLVARGHTLAEPATFWGYAVTSVVLLPVAALWAFAERSRWSSVVLAAAAVALGVVQWRLTQVWSA